MKIAYSTARNTGDNELDMQTIRRRVANIKKQWTPEVAQARAAEGVRRRLELDSMICGLLREMREECEFQADTADSAAAQLTLVG